MRRMWEWAAVSAAVLMVSPSALAETGTSPTKATPEMACADCLAALRAVADNPLRAEDRSRDQYRKPVETLSFFGITPTMKVGEYAPGGEWYSRFLGLYLGQKGQLVGLFYDPTSGPFPPERQSAIRASAAQYLSDVAKFTGLPASRYKAYTLDAAPEAEKGTFDAIIIPRMLHNLLRWNIADSEIKSLRALLKPNGVIGIEQHRAKADAPYHYSDGSKGYLREADVIRFMEINGFDLVGASQANANPKDSADWPEGVWTLPPTLRLQEQDKAKYLEIGESDRMTLLFRKRD